MVTAVDQLDPFGVESLWAGPHSGGTGTSCRKLAVVATATSYSHTLDPLESANRIAVYRPAVRCTACCARGTSLRRCIAKMHGIGTGTFF